MTYDGTMIFEMPRSGGKTLGKMGELQNLDLEPYVAVMYQKKRRMRQTPRLWNAQGGLSDVKKNAEGEGTKGVGDKERVVCH